MDVAQEMISNYSSEALDRQVNELAELIKSDYRGAIICSANEKHELRSIKKKLKKSLSRPDDKIIASVTESKIPKQEFRIYEISFEDDVVNFGKESDMHSLVKNILSSNFSFIEAKKMIDDFFKKRQNVIISIQGLEHILDAQTNTKMDLLQDFLVKTNHLMLFWMEDKNTPQVIARFSDFWLTRLKIFRFSVIPEHDQPKPIIVLSYISEDKDFVSKLSNKLEDYDVILWTFEKELLYENNRINDALENASNTLIFLPVLSPNYLQSDICRHELQSVLNKFVSNIYSRIFLLLYKTETIPTELNQYTSITFDEDFENSFDNLIRELDLKYAKLEDSLTRPSITRSSKDGGGIVKSNINLVSIEQINKPARFRGEKGLFIGRQEYIRKIKELLIESNKPISIIGIGGIGKSALALYSIHFFEDMFDIIIPLYCKSGLTFSNFLSEFVKHFNLSIAGFEKIDNICNEDLILHTLKKFNRVLIYLDSYETILERIDSNNQSQDAIKIHKFLENIPSNTVLFLTSRREQNFVGERAIKLKGMNKYEGKELFLGLVQHNVKKPSRKVLSVIDEIVQRTNGHPPSLEMLANSFKGSDLSELNQILDDLTEEFIPIIKPKYLDKFKANLEYSLQSLDEHVVKFLPKLTLFESPFPSSVVVSLFDLKEDTISDLYHRSILSRIDFDEYGEIPLEYRLYYFHTEIRKYLKQMINRNELESEYGEKFAECYSDLLNATYMAIGKEDQAWSVRRFNTIIKGENNDFNKAIILTKNNQLSAYISITVGKILSSLGIYDVSLAYHKKALEIYEKLENKNGIANLDIVPQYFLTYPYGNKPISGTSFVRAVCIGRVVE